MSAAPQVALPRWIDIGLLPIINLVQALIVAGLVVTGDRGQPVRRHAHHGLGRGL